MDARLNQLAKIDDFERALIIAQYAHEKNFRAFTGPELYNWLNLKLDVSAELMDPIPPGTAENPAVLPPGPAGQKRKFEPQPGFYQGFDEVTSDKRWYFYWNGTTWSLVDMGGLPSVDTSDLITKEDIGILNFQPNENFGSIFNINDESQFGLGFLNSDNTINSSSSSWRYLKNPISLPSGTYTTNQMLTEHTYLLILNNDGSVATAYNNKGNGAGTLNWDFVIGDGQSLRFSQATYFSPQLLMRTGAVISFPTSQVFVLAKDAAIKSDLTELEVRMLNEPKPYIKSAKGNTDWLLGLTYQGTLESLRDVDGNLLELFLTFMRFKDIGTGVISTIIQIAKRNPTTGVVGVNNISVSTFINESSGLIDDKGLFVATLVPVANSGLTFKIAIDTTKITSADLGVDLVDKFELNTAYFSTSATSTGTQKTIMSLGDSQVEFGNYPSVMGQKLGVNSLNAGVGGTRMSQHTLEFYNKLSFFQIADAIATGDFTSVNTALDGLIALAEVNDPQKAIRLTTTKNNLNNANYATMMAITVAFGTNDFTSNKDIGTVSLENVDTNTFVGAFNYGVGRILTAYPNLKIFVVSPTHRYLDNGLTQDSDVVANSSGIYLIEYVDALIEQANINHIPVLDLYRNGQFSKYNHTTYFVDGVHPNQLGYTLIGGYVAGFINKYEIV